MLGRPNVCIGYGLTLQPVLRAAAARGARQCWAGNGLEVPPDAGLFDHLCLDHCPPALADPDVPAVTTARPLRPSAPPPPERYSLPTEVDRLEGKPLVYATMGTIYSQDLTALRVVMDVLARLPVNVVATVGPGGDPAALSRDPASTAVAFYIPHDALLPKCSIVVSHGGSGSILEPLALGIPVVVIPQGADQFENAAAVERAGVGLVILNADLTPERVAAAVRRLLDDTDIPAATARVAQQITAMPGLDDGVAVIEQLASSRQ